MLNKLDRILYDRLSERFGDVQFTPGWAALGVHRTPSRSARPPAGFFVDCPFCSATGRLFLEVGYGQFDAVTGSDGLDRGLCLSHDCLADPRNRANLGRFVYADLQHRAGVITLPSPLRSTQIVPCRPAAVTEPGRIVSVDRLSSDNPAVFYLQQRDYDLDELATTWHVGFCFESEYRMLCRRIYIPVFMDGELVGWQGRYPGNIPDGWKTPKYYTMPGMRKSKLLYNIDVARQQPLVVICEGCTDVWRVGLPGVAMFGKHASKEQIRLLADVWHGKSAVILLDADAIDDAEELYFELMPFFTGRLVIARLPADIDPGICSRADLWRFIHAEAEKQRVDLPEIELARL